LPGLVFEDLSLDQSAQIARTVSAADVEAFAAVSGDDNPLHLDDAYAATTPFKRRIAHGMLTGAYISAVLGSRLPGPGAVYVSQTLRFRRPVGLGDEVTTTVTVRELDARRATPPSPPSAQWRARPSPTARPWSSCPSGTPDRCV